MKHHLMHQRVPFILDHCRGKRVLHIGCADAPYTAQRLRDDTLLHVAMGRVASELHGIDLSEESVRLLRAHGIPNVTVVDAEDRSTMERLGQMNFELVVAAEVLEHLSNPGLFLDSLLPVMKETTGLLITTVNATCAYRTVFTALTGRERNHPEHVAYFSPSTISRLLHLHGYSVEELAFYPIGDEHKPFMNRGFGRLLWWTDRLASKVAPTLADGLLVTCRAGVSLPAGRS